MNTLAVIGGPGTGKTTWVRALIEHYRHPRRRFLVWSLDGGYRGTSVGTAADLRRRQSWPPVALLDGSPTEAIRLARDVGNVTLVLDECQVAIPSTMTRLPEGHPLFDILYRGRHVGVFLVCVTQFPYNVGACVRDTWTRIAFFGMYEPSALDWVSRRCGSRVAAAVAAHTGHDPLLWSPQDGLLGDRGSESCTTQSSATSPPR